jgi:hypothetical protein
MTRDSGRENYKKKDWLGLTDGLCRMDNGRPWEKSVDKQPVLRAWRALQIDDGLKRCSKASATSC